MNLGKNRNNVIDSTDSNNSNDSKSEGGSA
jgi:hypothetical protein